MSSFLDKAMAILGKMPSGDPDELDAYARQLDSAAEKFEAVAKQFQGEVQGAGLIRGPLADRMKLNAEQLANETRRELALECREIATGVRAQAAQVRAAQEAWRGNLRMLTRRLENAARELAD